MRTKIIRILLYWMRLVIRPKVITINSIKIDVNSEGISEDMKKILYSGNYEVSESYILPRVLKHDDIVMEVGTGIGYISSLCYKIIQEENRIFTYEANPLLKEAIYQTFSLNNIKASPYNVVLSDSDGEMDFFISDKFYSSSLVAFDKKAKSIKVKTIDVNDVIQNIKPTFLIVDIEGFEIEFFKYINDYSSINAILLEIHPSKVENKKINDLINDLYVRGFVVDYILSKKHVLYITKFNR